MLERTKLSAKINDTNIKNRLSARFYIMVSYLRRKYLNYSKALMRLDPQEYPHRTHSHHRLYHCHHSHKGNRGQTRSQLCGHEERHGATQRRQRLLPNRQNVGDSVVCIFSTSYCNGPASMTPPEGHKCLLLIPQQMLLTVTQSIRLQQRVTLSVV
jgi:hypothetical protein